MKIRGRPIVLSSETTYQNGSFHRGIPSHGYELGQMLMLLTKGSQDLKYGRESLGVDGMDA